MHKGNRILRDEHRSISAVLSGLLELVRLARKPGVEPGFAPLHAMIHYIDEYPERLHHPKEESLLYARCHRRGMTDEDEPLEQTLERIDPGDRAMALDFAARLREYVDVIRCHIEVEEEVFFDTAQHYLTENDRHELTEEFEAVHWDEVEEGVASYWEDLAHRLWVAETRSA